MAAVALLLAAAPTHYIKEKGGHIHYYTHAKELTLALLHTAFRWCCLHTHSNYFTQHIVQSANYCYYVLLLLPLLL
jgi:hypothetical protein